MRQLLAADKNERLKLEKLRNEKVCVRVKISQRLKILLAFFA